MTEPVRRVHYFTGQLLTPEDLQAEQDYHRRMRYLHNRLLGQGIVDGLEVTAGDGSTIVVSPGMAVDGLGRELVLVDPILVDVCEAGDVTDRDGSLDLIVTWAEEPDGRAVATADDAQEASFTRWLERPRLALAPPGECGAESLVLARVLISGGEVDSVDTSPRSTWRRAQTSVQT